MVDKKSYGEHTKSYCAKFNLIQHQFFFFNVKELDNRYLSISNAFRC